MMRMVGVRGPGMIELAREVLAGIRTVDQMVAAFQDEERCRQLLEAMVWPRGRLCPKCGYKNSIALAGRDVGRRARPGLYQCSSGGCRFQFTVTTRTPLHSTKLPLRVWLTGLWLMLQSDKGISSVRLADAVGVGVPLSFEPKRTLSSDRPLAIGAAGVHLGPRALALAADLNKAKGLSMRKTCAVLRDCFGMQLSPGGLSQALDRLAAKVKPQYDALATELRQAPALHSDETSWWVAGPGWWLWVFTTRLLTFYVVAQSRGRELLRDILGKDFGGVLVSDCLAIYDDATALQHNSYAHHHKAIRQAKALHPQQGEGFLCEVEAMLRAAVALQEQKADLSLEIFSALRQALEHKAVQLLEPPRNEPNEEAVRNRLMPPTTWPNANCAQRSSRARSHVVTKPKKAREPGKSSLRWPPPAPSAPPVS
jgi:hypothetical protein